MYLGDLGGGGITVVDVRVDVVPCALVESVGPLPGAVSSVAVSRVAVSSAVDVAAKNLAGRDNVDVIQADLFRLPFRDGVFDMAYSVGVLHHTPDASGAFASVSKAVRPGGSFSIFVHARGNSVLYRSNLFLRRDQLPLSGKAHLLKAAAVADRAGPKERV